MLLPPSHAVKQLFGCGCPLHQQLWFVKPEPSHGWLDGKVEVPVVIGVKGMSRPPPETFDDALGRQLFEVGPKGPVPCTVQGGLPLTSVHVPVSPIWQLCGSGRPQSQIGQGRLT